MVEFSTGISTRVGYPTSCLASSNRDELKNPMYATGLGLVLEGFKYYDNLDETEQMKFYPELFEVVEVAPTLTFETNNKEEETEEEVEVTRVKVQPVNYRKQKGNFLKEMAQEFQNWFKDERVNGDFEG